MYLVHWFIMVALARALPAGTSLNLYFVIAMTILVAVASLSFILFERPIVAFGNARFGRVTHRFAPVAGIAATDPDLTPTRQAAT